MLGFKTRKAIHSDGCVIAVGLRQLGKVELMIWTNPTPTPAPGGLETQPQARRMYRGGGSEGWIGMLGWVIRVNWSWESLLAQVGEARRLGG